ncbi:MAG: ATP-binding protein [Paenibacillaceae bacterium]
MLSSSLLFFIAAVFLGYMMSGKAMVPIVEAFQRQKQFVADASHELRTPLSVVKSSLEVLEAEEHEHMQPFSKQVLHDLMDEVNRIIALSANLLTLARADSSEHDIKFERVQLDEEINKIARKLQPLVQEKSLQISYKVDPNLNLYASKPLIIQLLIILLDNAIHYTPEGGSISLTAQVDQVMAVIIIQDTGIGISEQQLDRVFERFYRADPSRSRSSGNVGLGLSIAKWIVDSHGGTIQVDSQVDQGTRFTITLPLRTSISG